MREKKYQITIRNWDKYQREMRGGEKRRRRRDWVAISTDLFSDPSFFEMDQCHRTAWIGLLCHAGKVGPVFELCPSAARLLFRLRRSPDFEVFRNQGFIDLKAATDKTRQYKTDKTIHKEKKPPPKTKIALIDSNELRAIYPTRAGGNPWGKAISAIKARMSEGHSWKTIADGIRRYAVFCDHTGKTGTEFVKYAATFCGPDKYFLEPWNIPKNKAESQQAKNINVLREWVNA